jgi:pyruvate formate lyase activating enzyme
MTLSARIFDIKRDCSEDGPGIRTTVFFQGCPLSCIWCQNPEGQIRKKPTSSNGEEPASPDPAREISLQELLYRVNIDRPFYDASGGGVTVSGGEATLQMNFLHHFLKALKKEGIHTALETCGFFNYRRFHTLLSPYLDLIYYDLKLFDNELSKRYTGQNNTLILENFKRLILEPGIEIKVRIPLIPGITSSEENLQKISHFLREHDIDSAQLMPYNPLWHDKAIKLHMQPHYLRREFMSADEIQNCIHSFQAAS